MGTGRGRSHGDCRATGVGGGRAVTVVVPGAGGVDVTAPGVGDVCAVADVLLCRELGGRVGVGDGGGGVRGEACFPTTVTLAWDVGWGSNIGAGGTLGEGSSSVELCLVVAELQAVV